MIDLNTYDLPRGTTWIASPDAQHIYGKKKAAFHQAMNVQGIEHYDARPMNHHTRRLRFFNQEQLLWLVNERKTA